MSRVQQSIAQFSSKALFVLQEPSITLCSGACIHILSETQWAPFKGGCINLFIRNILQSADYGWQMAETINVRKLCSNLGHTLNNKQGVGWVLYEYIWCRYCWYNKLQISTSLPKRLIDLAMFLILCFNQLLSSCRRIPQS